MKRLMEKTVFSGLVMAWRRATWPISCSPLAVMATTEGVVRAPSPFSITIGSPASNTAAHEFVVPRSMPSMYVISSPQFLAFSSQRPIAGVEPSALIVTVVLIADR